MVVAYLFCHKSESNMNKSKIPKVPVQSAFAAGLAIMALGGLASTLYSAEPQSAAQPQKTDSTPAPTNSVAVPASVPVTDTNKVFAKAQITGAELYSINCNRCHQERYPTERTGAQWKTIMLHMQVRANIPVSQARLILQYLQENSGR
jgi:mono/diheme cytochrome c family protein